MRLHTQKSFFWVKPEIQIFFSKKCFVDRCKSDEFLNWMAQRSTIFAKGPPLIKNIYNVPAVLSVDYSSQFISLFAVNL